MEMTTKAEKKVMFGYVVMVRFGGAFFIPGGVMIKTRQRVSQP